jgi:hypothetical protein
MLKDLQLNVNKYFKIFYVNYIKCPLVLVAPEDGQLRLKHVEHKDYLFIKKLNMLDGNFMSIITH